MAKRWPGPSLRPCPASPLLAINRGKAHRNTPDSRARIALERVLKCRYHVLINSSSVADALRTPSIRGKPMVSSARSRLVLVAVFVTCVLFVGIIAAAGDTSGRVRTAQRSPQDKNPQK